MALGSPKLPLSVAIITKNEEERLPDCLASVAFADEVVVVVDAESEDRTVEIAKEFGAKVFVEPWRGFGVQKQFAIDQCKNSWVLVLDADERLSKESVEELHDIISDPVICEAYSIPRKNYFFGRWIRHAGWWPDRTIRLFRNGKARMSPQLVHESLQVGGRVCELRHPLIHFPFRNLRHMMRKMDEYSTAGAEGLFAAGKTASIYKAVSRALWALFYNYIFRGGFLDGGAGVIIAISDATNIFFKYAKLAELNKQTGKFKVDCEE